MLCNCQMRVHTLQKPAPSLHVLGVHGSGVPMTAWITSYNSGPGTHPSGCRLARQLQAQVVCEMVAVELQ